MSKEYSDEEIRSLAAQRWGIQVKRGSGYHCGPCPFCRTGRDRFVIWKAGNFWCRVCGEKGWLDDNRQDWKPDPEWIRENQVRLHSLEQERQKRLRDWREGFKAGHYQGWHEAMTFQQRNYWIEAGIPEWAIDYYGMGYCQDKVFRGRDGENYHSPAYTIPVRNPSNWEVVNVQYRLVDPPPGVGKYRQEYELPSAAFYTRRGVLEGQAILLEGAKKAIVILECIGKACQVVGLPGVTPSERLLREMEVFDHIYFIPDPGVEDRAIERIGKVLYPRVRLVEMPVKPDDAVLYHGLGRAGLREYVRQARRI